MTGLYTLLLLPLFVSYVSAHGYVNRVTVGGKTFEGNPPYEGGQTPKATVIRQVQNRNPSGIDSADLACGAGAKAASEMADVNPGDEVSFDWGSWPHGVGPVMTYLASCGSTTCDKFDTANAKWFKIEQDGRRSDGKWAMADIQSGIPASVKIPSNLKAGNYLIRNELLALHSGAEFYPSCAQLRVGGSGTGTPSDSETVSFPGGYKSSDPGIGSANAYDASASYTFPGPPVASLAGGSGSGSGDAPASTSASSRPTASSTSPATGSGSPSGSPSATATSKSTGATGSLPAPQPTVTETSKPTTGSASSTTASPSATATKSTGTGTGSTYSTTGTGPVSGTTSGSTGTGAGSGSTSGSTGAGTGTGTSPSPQPSATGTRAGSQTSAPGTAAPASTPTPTSTGTGKVCRRKVKTYTKRAVISKAPVAAELAAPAVTVAAYPRHVSRVMRRAYSEGHL